MAGLGNELLRDDGVGIHVVRELRGTLPLGVIVAEVGTGILNALHLIDWAERVLAIDAVQAGLPPGTVCALRADDVAAPGSHVSMHQVGLLEARPFLRNPHRQREILFLGVEPAVIDYGTELSPEVHSAIPEVVMEARRIISGWLRIEVNPSRG